MSSHLPSLKRDSFEIAILCALPLEASAVKAIFEEVSSHTAKAAADPNEYTTGTIGRHHVVLTHMPGMGEIAAAAVASNLKHSFGGIRLALLVGICGGVPDEAPSGVRLGDIIIGKHVVQYDFGRQYPDGFKRKSGTEDALGRQSPEIRAFLSKLESAKKELEAKTQEHLAALLEKRTPGEIDIRRRKDDLFPADYLHKHHSPEDCADKTCTAGEGICDAARKASCAELKCDTDELERRSKPKPAPNLHFGSVASASTVMKSGEARDALAQAENVIAFDMEGAGVWEYLPCAMVKAVCDYADSHKNKDWQDYAATAAAAATKAILEHWTPKGHVQDQSQVT